MRSECRGCIRTHGDVFATVNTIAAAIVDPDALVIALASPVLV
jgi:hypothetical protein